jgi:flagellar biogenesis protein FliO
VTILNQPNAVPPWIRSRIPALVGIGTFVVLVGILAPRLMTPISDSPTDAATSTAPKSDADGPGEQASPKSATTPIDVLRPIEQIVIGISVVIAIGCAAFWFVGRQRASSVAQGPALLNITAALPLRQNCWAYLVEVGGHQFLAGVDPTGIRSVLPLPSAPQETVEEPIGLAQPILTPTIFPPLVTGGRQ